MFEKKITDEERKAQLKEEKKAKRAQKMKDTKWAVKGVEIAKIVVIPLLLASIMVCFLYIVVRNNTLAENLKSDVVIAKKEIAANTKITADEVGEYFMVVAVEKTAVSKINFTSLESMPDSFYVEASMVKGQMVYKDDVEESDFVMDKYTEEAVVTSIEVSDFSNSVCGTIRHGDIIDIYAVDPLTDELVFVVGNIYVKEAYNNSAEVLTGKEGSAVAFTLLLMPEEVELVNKAIVWEGIQIYKR